MRFFILPLLAFCQAWLVSSATAADLDSIAVAKLDGGSMCLGDFTGKVVLLVNVASQCGYTGQYAGLEELHKAYASKGLVVIGFPCNDFGGQEPGSAQEIRQFCQSQYQVSFPMAAKIQLSSGTHPLFAALLKDGPVQWNFEKFLLGRDHQLIKRFGSDAQPTGAELEAAVLEALKAPVPKTKAAQP
jgi:glutathione peroxidase